MKARLNRLFSAVLVLAALYLVPVNLALNLPATRAYLNGVDPDRFAIHWENAWSLHPLRVELSGLAADGQTPAEQWQLDARRAAASVSLMPLLKGEIRVHDLDLRDVDLRMRPRPASQGEHGDFAAFYPVIRNRDPDAPAETETLEESGTLLLEIDNIHVKGEHAFWVSHVRGSLPGEVRGGFRVDTQAGRLSLADGALNLAIRSLQIADQAPLTDAASIKGRVHIPPFAPSRTQGLALYRVPDLDAEIDIPVQSLDFLALFIPPVEAMGLSGKGRLRGRVVLSAGEVLGGTDLVVEAHELKMDLGPYGFSGDGSVEVLVDPQDEAQADLIVRFDQVQAELDPARAGEAGGSRVLFAGSGLTAELHAAETDPTTTSTAERPDELLSELELKLLLTVPSMHVPDLAVYDRLLPDKWGVHVLGGQGEISGSLVVEEQSIALKLDLSSDDADLRFRDDHITTDLSLALRLKGHADAGPTLDLSGTELLLDEARVTRGDDRERRPWRAELSVGEGRLEIPVPADWADGNPVSYLTRTLVDQGLGRLLADADGRVAATLSVSRLGWIPRLLDVPFGLTLSGPGAMDATLLLEDGWPAKGTTLEAEPQRLKLGLLDHLLEGRGHATLELASGGDRPDLRLNVELEDAQVTRSGEGRPEVDQLRLKAEILVTDITPGGTGKTRADLRIPSARIPDLGALNPYLPPHAPVRLLSGAGSLIGDLRLQADRSQGELLFRAEDVRVALAEEELSGDLKVDVLVRDGTPNDMRFDISGSQILLDDIRVKGDTASFARDDWRAHFEIETAKLVWNKPLHLEMRALATVRDTRPFVAILDNVRGEHGWIDRLLEAEDLAGHLELTLDGERAVLSDAMLGGPGINIGAKGRTDAEGLEGLLYVRWQNLTGALALQGGERHFHWFNAREMFDAYVPGETALAGEKPAGPARFAEGPEAVSRARGLRGSPNPSDAGGRQHRPDAEDRSTAPENLFLHGDP